MKTIISLFCFILFGSCIAHAQLITGKVIDTSSQPVSFANIVLLTNDSTFIRGVVSDNNGLFQIEYSPAAVLLKVTYIGYREKLLPILALHGENEDMGNIVLDDDALVLQEVVVKASIPVTRIKGDALVTTVQGSILEKAGTANDVLSKLPGVTLENEELNVFGRGAPLIYINGREVRDTSELERLTSDNIQSVEVISNPGARYAKSVKAVIRIRTKQNTDNGFGLSERANVSYNRYWGGYNQLGLNYRHNGFDAAATLHYNERAFWRKGMLVYNNYLADFWENQSDITEFRRNRQLFADLSLNYAFNSAHSVGVHYSFNRNPRSIENNDFLSDLSKNGQREESTVSAIYNLSQYYGHTVDAYYSGKVSDWSIDFNASMLSNNMKSGVTTDEQVTTTDAADAQRVVHTFSNVDNQLYAAKLAVEHPLWDGQLSFGGEYSYTSRHNEYLNKEQVVPDNDSRVKESLAAGFVEYQRTFFDKLQLQAGLRLEHTGFDYYEYGVYKPEQSRTYTNLFPSLSLNYPIGKVQLQLGYSSDVTRPSYSMLNDEVYYVNRYTYAVGNPFLLPNITRSITFRASYRWLQLYASFNRSSDEILTIIDYYSEDDPSIAVERQINSKAYNYVNVNLTAAPTIGIWSPQWELRLYKQWYSIEKPGGNGELLQMNRLSPTLRWNNAFRLPQGFILNAGFTWRGKREDTNVSSDAYWTSTASLYKEFLNGNLSFLLAGNDLFDTQRRNMTMYSGKMQQTMVKNRFNNQSVSLTITYKFNQKRSKYKGTGAGSGQRGRL